MNASCQGDMKYLVKVHVVFIILLKIQGGVAAAVIIRIIPELRSVIDV